MPGQRGQHRQQPLLDGRRLQRREQHDQRALPAERGHRAGQRGPVGLGDHRLEVGHRVLEAWRPRRGRRPPVAGRAPGGRRPRSRPGRRPGRPARRAAARRPWPSRAGGRPRRGRPRCARCPAPAPPGGPARAARCGRRRCGCGRWPASRSSGRRRRGRTRAASRTRCPGRAPAPPTGRRGRAAGPAATGRCLRDSNGGSDRTVPGTSSVRWREARPSGPRARTVTPCARRSPRRTGCSGVRSSTRSPGVSRIGNRLPVAPAVGCQASRTQPRDGAARRVGDDERGRRGVAEPHRVRRPPADLEHARASGRAASRRPPPARRPAATATWCRTSAAAPPAPGRAAPAAGPGR